MKQRKRMKKLAECRRVTKWFTVTDYAYDLFPAGSKMGVHYRNGQLTGVTVKVEGKIWAYSQY